MKAYSESESTFRDLLTVFFRYRLLNTVIFIVVMITVYIGVEFRTPTYSSSVTILVSGKMQKDLDYERELGAGSITETQMELVRSKPIIERTVRFLKLHKRPVDYEKKFASPLKKIFIEYNRKQFERDLEVLPPKQREEIIFNRALSELTSRIDTRPLGETSLFSIFVTDYSPGMSAKIANVLSRSFVIFDIEQQIAELKLTYGEKNASIIKLENYIKELEESLDGRLLPDIEAIGPASVKIVAQAKVGRRDPVKPGKPVAFMLAFIMSIAGGIMLSFGLEYFDQTFKSPQDVEKYLKIPYLGSIPERQSKAQVLINDAALETKYSQSFQNLSNYIYLSMKNNNLKSLLLSDVEGSDDAAVIAANLSLCLSRKGHSVLVIDCNFRNPVLHKIFNVDESPGFLDVIEANSPLEAAIHNIESNISILTIGNMASTPVSFLDATAMSEIMSKLKNLYDVILLNCADIKNYTDAVILSSHADGFILMLNEGKIKRQIVKHVVAPLVHKNVNIVGAILTNRRYVIPEIIYKLI